MKKRIVKLLAFFRKESLAKYFVEIGFFVLVLSVFFILAKQDVVSNVAGTIIGFLFSTMLFYVFRVVSTAMEDAMKVNKDTKALLKLYSGAPSYRKTLKMNGTQVEFAYADCLIDKNYTYEVIDRDEQTFKLDDFIVENFATLFSAHMSSTKFNGTTIRLDDMVKEGEKVTFWLSRSTVFNHLLTNRVIDFVLFDTVSLRDLYEYGPVLHSFRDSKMSNHIGINALVFLKDGRLLIPRRNKVSTISKNQVTSSIAVKLDFPKGSTSVSADYLLRDNLLDNLTARIHLNPRDVDREKIRLRFLGMGQNIYEGGKPQFYFCVFLDDIDTQRYFQLNLDGENLNKIDVDRCIYVADYATICFQKDQITFDVETEKGKRKHIKCKYEMSYLCNLWHYEQTKDSLTQ